MPTTCSCMSNANLDPLMENFIKYNNIIHTYKCATVKKCNIGFAKQKALGQSYTI